jgi:steroid 5-alpha reductase family enzyme
MSSFPTSSFLVSLPLTAAAVVVVLGVTLLVALGLHRHAVVDVSWGLGFAVIAATSFGLSSGHGSDLTRAVEALLTICWGGRLATHIALRSRGAGEDPRYRELMDKTPGNPMLVAVRKIYLTQGAVMWFVSLPVQVAMFEPSGLGVLGWVGVAIWIVGFGFETVGDLQLTRFRNDPSSKGQVLDTGLWHYTRHPNYFGDATVWWGLSLVAFAHWPGILTLLSPLLMTWLLAKGTGKPLLEKDLTSRRPGYAEYVRRTSGFVPLPPRSSSR